MTTLNNYFPTGIEERLAKKMSPSFCDPECEWLYPKERKQRRGDMHHCYKYGKTVYHGAFHPNIIAVKGCKLTIKGEKTCQKVIQNAKCSETVAMKSKKETAPQPVITIIRRTLKKLWIWRKR